MYHFCNYSSLKTTAVNLQPINSATTSLITTEFCPQCLHEAYIVLPLIWDLKVLKGVLFLLFTSSVSLISGSTILSPLQVWCLAWIIASSAMLFSRPLYWLLRLALNSACRSMFTVNILKVFAALLYPWHVCELKGLMFLLFTLSFMLVLGLTMKSSQQYWYLGQGYCLLSNAIICAFVLSPKVSSYLGLKNCCRSIYPGGICSIVVPAAYLIPEGCIIFNFHFISKAHISVYNIVSAAVLISGLSIAS